MYFPDLTPIDLAGSADVPRVLQVGWLDVSHEYPRGDVQTGFFEALCRLLVNPWQPAVACGHHPCSFCRFSGGPGFVHFEGMSIALGATNLFVPGDGVIYLAPSLVAHFVDAHGYAPPAGFQSAVIECPPMRSMQYLHRVLGISALMRGPT